MNTEKVTTEQLEELASAMLDTGEIGSEDALDCAAELVDVFTLDWDFEDDANEANDLAYDTPLTEIYN